MTDVTGNARDRIINATLLLLRSGGLSAAGLNDITKAAKAPKGSLYHYFPNGKAQMVSEAIHVYAGFIDARIHQSLSGSGALSGRINSLFSDVADRMQVADYQQSCAVGAVLLDLGDGQDDEILRKQCDLILKQWANTASQALLELPQSRRSQAGRLLIALLEGSQILARATQSAAPLREAARAFNLWAKP
jgi:TetR/AcrR family transcriptional regulator, lmrAB and yxaGH operons repressor